MAFSEYMLIVKTKMLIAQDVIQK